MAEDTATRSKGPLVWLDMDQKALDDAYDQSVYAANQALVATRRDRASDRAREALGDPVRHRYGPTEIESLDLYRTSVPGAPIAVYIHGGAWRRGTAAQHGLPSEMFVNAGAHYIAVDFNNVDETGGDLFPMVDQVRRAVAWVWQNAAKEVGGDPNQLYVMGHSSGAHLSSCVAITDWAGEYGLPERILAGVMSCSGMFDLTPVRMSKRSEYVNFTDEMVEKLSAIRHLDRITMPIITGYGTEETPEFQRQNKEFAAALRAAGKDVELLVGEGYNHFEMFETLANPYGLLGRSMLRMMGLGPG